MKITNTTKPYYLIMKVEYNNRYTHFAIIALNDTTK